MDQAFERRVLIVKPLNDWMIARLDTVSTQELGMHESYTRVQFKFTVAN